MCKRTMIAPDASLSLISYRDLRANEIFVYIALESNEEVMMFMQRQRILATAHAGEEDFYSIVIKPVTINLISLIDEEKVCLTTWVEDPIVKIHNLDNGSICRYYCQTYLIT